MAKQTSVQYFSNKAATFEQNDGAKAAHAAQFYQQALGALNISIPVGAILDVGIATGILSKPFSDKGFDVYGVDGSKKMIDRSIANGVNPDNLQQVNLTRSNLPYDDDSFEVTVTSSTLFYLENACDVVREMIRVTKPGGLIIIDPEIHNADTDTVFRYAQAEDRPYFFIQSGGILADIFEETGVEILDNRPFSVRSAEHPQFGSYQIANNFFILRKLSPQNP